nr:hypothetical protein [uncultured Deefgea sp.]
MKFKILCTIAFISTSVVAADPAMPEQMMRGRSSQYQDGFRDGFREAVRMMNGAGTGSNQWGRDIRIARAKYGSNYGSCDFTPRLGRSADGKSSYAFKAGNRWCGDPSRGHSKAATIEYYCGNKLNRAYVRENQVEYLRCR